ncbi:MAG TPA: hypothetical protein VLX85_02540 [Stellaceae bacterium]|nr:hypothetical protein [Stellaceae bacterium]
MAMEVQNVMPDIAGGRATINISDPEANEMIQVGFPMNFSSNDTLNRAEALIRSRAKQLLLAAIDVL